MAAWDCYLRGQWHFYQFTESSRRQAIYYFERAVALDAFLVDAHIGIARVLHSNTVYAIDRGRLAEALAAAPKSPSRPDAEPSSSMPTLPRDTSHSQLQAFTMA
jgi:hypothetical protein